MLHNDILETQRALEDASFTVGAERYRDAQDRKAAREGFERRDDVSKIIRGAIPIVAEGITAWVSHAKAAKGRKPVGLAAIELLDPDLLAYVGLSKAFHHVVKDTPSTTQITRAIGQAVQIELEAAALQEQDPKAVRRYRALAEGEAREVVNRRRHERLVERTDVAVELNWAADRQVLTGQIVLGIILVKLKDVFERFMLHDARGTQPAIRLTDEASQALNAMTDAAAWLRPALQPMLVEPRPWIGLNTGCYFDPRLSKTVPLVRTFSSEHKRLIREAIKDGSMQEVLDAVNAIQETRWAIDRRVLDVVLWARENGLRPSPSFPTSHVPALLPKTPKDAWEALTPEARTAKSRERKTIRDIRAAAGVEGGVFSVDTEMASFLADYDAFFLPHSLDFRGRVYAVPHFNHQRSDHMKGMFRFADAVPLGPDGGRWLMIHLANCGDFGKVSKQPFDARVAWVRENELDVLMCAVDPQGTYDYWSQADSPFCFLQACFEYHSWMKSGFSEAFLSTIAVAADGSCSGLQHYAALTRSETEAMHVNLLPRDDVGDIYQIAANAAIPTLTDAARTGCAISALILANGFGRSEVKRNVMTYFYGSGKFGMRDQHMEDKMRPLADQVALGSLQYHPYSMLVDRTDKATGEVTQHLDGGFSCAQVMAAHTYQAIVTIAPKADEAASWIQSVAAVLAHESQSMIWRTPTGMPVVQRYSEYTSKTVNLWLYDRSVHVPTGSDKVDHEGNVLSRVQVLVREAPTKRVAKKRMRSASSPNVIHSMDGAHLQRSVVMGLAAGIRHFAMIHDSFGTHAGNMTTFSRVIREAFVATYADYCPLAELDRYARSVLSEEGAEKLPPIPAKGDLELTRVLESLYAFA